MSTLATTIILICSTFSGQQSIKCRKEIRICAEKKAEVRNVEIEKEKAADPKACHEPPGSYCLGDTIVYMTAYPDQYLEGCAKEKGYL